MSTWRRRLEPSVRPAFHAWARLRRGATLGVRGVVTDALGHVLLVEHTYIHGWHLPGGGVDRGESCEVAVIRELAEEAGVKAESRPLLLSVHDNGASFPGDHVLLFRVERWSATTAAAQGEIARTAFFDPLALPPGVSRGTRARLAEVFEGAPPDPLW